MLRLTMNPASRGRLLLAAYVDYVLFTLVFEPGAWLLKRGGVQVTGWVVSLVLFVAVELLLVRLERSPGRAVLGIVALDGRQQVLPAWRARERWWTMLLGTLGISEGAKEAVRWTFGLPPPPFMGLALDWDTRAAIVTTNGIVFILAGLGVLCTRVWGTVLGVAVCVVGIASWIASWSQVPAWVAARTIARRNAQGLPVREGEIEMMTRVLPGGALFGAVMGGLLLVLALRRFRRADRAAS